MKAKKDIYKKALLYAGFNLERGFFSLRDDEIRKIDDIRKSFKYYGRSRIGRSPAQSFWYYCGGY